MSQVFIDGPVVVTGENFTITPYKTPVTVNAIMGIEGEPVVPVFTYRDRNPEGTPMNKWTEGDRPEAAYRRATCNVPSGVTCTHWKVNLITRGLQGGFGYTLTDVTRLPSGEWPPVTEAITVP